MLKKLLTYAAGNAGLAWLIWQGAFLGVAGAANVALVFVWLTIVTAPVYLSDDWCAKRAAMPMVPRWLATPVLFSQAGAMVWAGWVVTGSAYFMAGCLAMRIYAFAPGGKKCRA